MSLHRHMAMLAAVAALLWGCSPSGHGDRRLPMLAQVTAENLHSISFPDPQHLWLFGGHGTILFSGDQGATWQQQPTPTEVLLGDGVFVDQHYGWAAGVGGCVLGTRDGGRSWHMRPSGVEANLLELFFLDRRRGWAVGELGTIVHTVDGGLSWRRLRQPEDTLFNAVYFVDPLTGWVAGEFGTILHTTDGGVTWQVQSCPEIGPDPLQGGGEQPPPALYGVLFADRNRGLAVGMDGTMIRTRTGGDRWHVLPVVTPHPLYTITRSDTQVWAVGSRGVVLQAAAMEGPWRLAVGAVQTRFWLRDIAFCGRYGCIVGARGTIIRSDDEGHRWTVRAGFGAVPAGPDA